MYLNIEDCRLMKISANEAKWMLNNADTNTLFQIHADKLRYMNMKASECW